MSTTEDEGCVGALFIEEHPGWCSPEHCYRTEDGVRVHVQAPTSLDGGDDVDPLRIETSLFDPRDDPKTYLELSLRDPASRHEFYALLTLDTARALRDQLTAHLDRAAGGADDRTRPAHGGRPHRHRRHLPRLRGRRRCDHPMTDTVCLPATELISIDSMASVDTVVWWWCRLCDHHDAARHRPAAHADGVEHLTAEHRATISVTAP